MLAIPDALSRRHNHKDIPNPPQVMLGEEQFIGFSAELAEDLMGLICNAQEDDESLKTLIQSMKGKSDLPPLIRA